MDLQKQLSKLEQDSFNGQISISDFRKRVQTYAETYHALQLQQTSVSGSIEIINECKRCQFDSNLGFCPKCDTQAYCH